MSFIRKELFLGTLMLCPAAWAGIDSGGTLTVCGQPIEEWSVPMSEIVGYKNYRVVIDQLKKDVPTLAARLEQIEKHSWFYPPCDPGKIRDNSLDIPTKKAIAYYDDFLIAFKFNLQSMKDPSKALFHESVRNLCHEVFGTADQATQETNCTLRNTDLIYNKYGKGAISGSELLASLKYIEGQSQGYGSEGRPFLDSDKRQLSLVLEYLKNAANTAIPDIAKVLQESCEGGYKTVYIGRPQGFDNLLGLVPDVGGITPAVKSGFRLVFNALGMKIFSDNVAVNCMQVANAPAIIAQIQSDIGGLDENRLAERYVAQHIFKLDSTF